MPDTDPLTELTRPASSLDSLIAKHSERTGLDPDLVRRLVKQESRGNSRAVSPKGAGGTMQLMPGTAAQMGVKNRFDPDENIRGGTDYLKQQLDKFGDVNLALAAYNAGPGAVIKHGNKVPPYAETQNYVKTIGHGYQGTGYAQDPLTALTSGTDFVPPSDPLTEVTQQPEAQQPRQQTSRAPSPADLNAQLLGALQKSQPRTRSKKSILSPQGIEVGGKVGEPSDADQVRNAVRASAPPGFGLLPTDAQNAISEQIAKGATSLTQAGAGLVRNLPHDPLAGQNQVTDQAANQLNAASQTMARGGAEMEKQANRPTVNVPVLGKVGMQDVYNVGGGAAGSAPAMVLTSLGVPAPVAFGLQSYLQASGRDADWQDTLKETGVGAATGALFEIPVPSKMALLARIGAKLGIVGGGTYGIEKLAGMPEGEARKNAAVNALFGASGEIGKSAPEAKLAEAIPASQPREFAPTLRPSELAQRTGLREQGTIPAATLPEALPERRLATIPLGPRRGPTPRTGESPVIPERPISEQPGVGIGPQSGDIMHANAQIDALNRRLREVAQIKNPTGRAQKLQANLESQLADATAARNALLDPKVQAQMEGRPLTDVLAERRQNERPTGLAETGIPSEPITEPAATEPHPSTRQNRRVRNVASGTKGQFKPGFKEEVTAEEPLSSPTGVGTRTPASQPPEAVESQSPAANILSMSLGYDVMRGDSRELRYNIKHGNEESAAIILIKPNGNADVELTGSGAGSLGIRNVLALRNQLQSLHPEIQAIEFKREGSTGGVFGRKGVIRVKPRTTAPKSEVQPSEVAATEAPQVEPTEQIRTVPQTPELTPATAVSPQTTPDLAAQPAVATETTAITPETKPSRLAQGVEAKAIAANLTKGFEGLPEYSTVKVADQAERAVKLLNDDPDLAKRIATGEEHPPNGLLPEAIFTAVENRALASRDTQTLLDLARGSRSVEASGMGQRLRLLAERNPNSAVAAIQQIEKARSKGVSDEQVRFATNKVRTELQVEMKKAAPKIKDWASFLDSIRC